jgi:hypothetical protein
MLFNVLNPVGMKPRDSLVFSEPGHLPLGIFAGVVFDQFHGKR